MNEDIIDLSRYSNKQQKIDLDNKPSEMLSVFNALKKECDGIRIEGRGDDAETFFTFDRRKISEEFYKVLKTINYKFPNGDVNEVPSTYLAFCAQKIVEMRKVKKGIDFSK